MPCKSHWDPTWVPVRIPAAPLLIQLPVCGPGAMVGGGSKLSVSPVDRIEVDAVACPLTLLKLVTGQDKVQG